MKKYYLRLFDDTLLGTTSWKKMKQNLTDHYSKETAKEISKWLRKLNVTENSRHEYRQTDLIFVVIGVPHPVTIKYRAYVEYYKYKKMTKQICRFVERMQRYPIVR